jgi:hypothetical protein
MAVAFVAFGIYCVNRFYQWWIARRLLGFSPDEDSCCCRKRLKGVPKPRPELPVYIPPFAIHVVSTPSTLQLAPFPGYEGSEGAKRLKLDRTVDISFKVTVEDTLLDLKSQYEQLASKKPSMVDGKCRVVRVGNQALLHNGRALEDDEKATLECGLKEGETLTLVPIEIKIKLPGDRWDSVDVRGGEKPRGQWKMRPRTLTLTVVGSDTLAEIKEYISRETGALWHEITQPLLFGEELLEEDGRTVFAYVMAEGSVIELAKEPEEEKKKLTGPVSTFDIFDYG